MPDLKSQSNKPNLIWLNICIFTFTLIVSLLATPYWAMTHGFDSTQIFLFICCFIFAGMSITAGYHRLWAHRAYQAHPALKIVFALGGALAMQNSILHWCSDHRIHHRHVDNNDIDPYSAKKGFWFSHIGWMLRKYHANRYHDYSNCTDLQKDPIVIWQHKHFLILVLLTNLGIPVLLGILHGDLIGTILLISVTRLVMNHHCTFFINSLAHIWGKQPYTNKNTARDNNFLAVLTFGEGYHNFHHIFESDYRNGVYWWQFDPTKWFIKTASWLKLANKLRITPPQRVEKAKAATKYQRVKDKLLAMPEAKQKLLLIENEYTILVQRMTDYYDARRQYLEMKHEGFVKKYEKAVSHEHIKQLKIKLKQQQLQWHHLIAQYA